MSDKKLPIIFPKDLINHIKTFQDVKEICKTQLSKNGKMPSDKTLRNYIIKTFNTIYIIDILNELHLDIVFSQKPKQFLLQELIDLIEDEIEFLENKQSDRFIKFLLRDKIRALKTLSTKDIAKHLADYINDMTQNDGNAEHMYYNYLNSSNPQITEADYLQTLAQLNTRQLCKIIGLLL